MTVTFICAFFVFRRLQNKKRSARRKPSIRDMWTQGANGKKNQSPQQGKDLMVMIYIGRDNAVDIQMLSGKVSLKFEVRFV